MTPEEKVALLKEAGVWDVIGFPSCIDKLFDLVAAHEREACAKSVYDSTDWAHEERDMVLKEAIAAAIRARGE